MITIEIHNQFITWPDDVAITMMRYYHQHGVRFTLHRKCAHAGWNTTVMLHSATEAFTNGGSLERPVDSVFPKIS